MTEPVERSIGDVMTDVAGNVERLVRTEVRLTKATVLEGIRGMARGTALVVTGVLLSTLTVMLLLLGAVARLSEVMKVWQAALLVAGGTAVVSALVIGIGVTALRGHAEHFDS
jgi:hypothetical protein